MAGVVFLGGVVSAAADEDAPDADFLEYLGSWEDSDEEWLIFATPADKKDTKRNDPAPRGEESVERDDED